MRTLASCRRASHVVPGRAPQAQRRRRGAAVVEFAAVAPVLFLLIFGMIEFGRMVMVQQVLTNASREGARVGILDGATNSEVTNVVQNYLNAANINGAKVETDPKNIEDAGAGDSVKVIVTVDFNKVTWLPAPIFLGGKGLSASTVMRRETVQ